ncbi:peptide-N4-(N-acetyl-beta-glucosaminyl)asparagine amidase A-like [Amaranthus tricolor]|uniref:peptide-N4-(N-acetyl-beta- glucosaminyl)asparagine amidase A-like n=1 Tax=Amaranthus tricolor TaxID=29722 RepID=UPI00258ADBA2|nr:peptide-N4-(N-acetyl-beta-glucosaminyl)asparagine amidase A-like [Amaranthus tricolor]
MDDLLQPVKNVGVENIYAVLYDTTRETRTLRDREMRKLKDNIDVLNQEKEKHDVPKVGPTKTTNRQYDRIFGIWVEGVELHRSCTAEPTHSRIFWNVRKDVTKYSSLLMKSNLNLSVYMGNIVNKTYTGVYHGNLVDLYGNSADLKLPISRNLPLNDGLWFEIHNSTDFKMKELVIPKNVYRTVLEIYVSFHENDEFWYTNLDNDYLMANLSLPGNGPFREVLVKLDDDLVGVVWPFTVIFTGGINPLLWRPIIAIGSFDLPSYDIEITPFLGKLLDGNPHRFGFCVTNSLFSAYSG